MAEKVDSPSPVPMGYAQWVSMTLCNLSDQVIKVKNVVISEGKLYADGEYSPRNDVKLVLTEIPSQATRT